MATNEIVTPFQVFHDLDGGVLENGKIYIGVENDNPETNAKQVYWDEDLTETALQPIRTIGGTPHRNGSPSRFYVEDAYSITVRDANDTLVYTNQSQGSSTAAAADSVEASSGTSDKDLENRLQNALLDGWDTTTDTLRGGWDGVDGSDWAAGTATYSRQINSGTLTNYVSTSSAKAGQATDADQYGVRTPTVPIESGKNVSIAARWAGEDATTKMRIAIRYFDDTGADISSGVLDAPSMTFIPSGSAASFTWVSGVAAYVLDTTLNPDVGLTFEDVFLTGTVDDAAVGIQVGFVNWLSGVTDWIYIDAVQICTGACRSFNSMEVARALRDTSDATQVIVSDVTSYSTLRRYPTKETQQTISGNVTLTTHDVEFLDNLNLITNGGGRTITLNSTDGERVGQVLTVTGRSDVSAGNITISHNASGNGVFVNTSGADIVWTPGSGYQGVAYVFDGEKWRQLS